MRTLDEQLAVRFPRLVGLLAGLVTRLAPTSRLRNHLVARRTCQGCQAVNRGDLDLLLTIYHDDVVIWFDTVEGWPLDLIGEHQGKEAFARLWDAWNSTWDDLRIEPRELIDAGDRLVVTLEMSGRGKASGVPSTIRYFDVYTLRGGRIGRHDMYRDRAAALAAAGVFA